MDSMVSGRRVRVREAIGVEGSSTGGGDGMLGGGVKVTSVRMVGGGVKVMAEGTDPLG
jgi:hypothetical protein